MPHSDDRPKSSLMNENFVDVIIESKKLAQHKCKHCDHQTIKSVAQSQQHLKICEAFQQKQERKKQRKSSKNTVQLSIVKRPISQTIMSELNT
jgi:hypothetical protein